MKEFDLVIDRHNTDSLKHDFAAKRHMPEDVIPLWVADMDFKTPNAVIEALKQVSEHGIYGYSDSRDDYFEILKNWFSTRFSFHIENDWLVKTPGIVYAIATAIRGLTEEMDGVLIQEPVYYPFRESIEVNNRRVVVNELVYSDGKYSIDFIDFEEKIIIEKVKLFILCSPHNPVGRVWSKEELEKMGDICLKHNVLIIADEIHADFTYSNIIHTIFPTIKKEFETISILCTSPTKTFNLAGLQISNIFIMEPSIRNKFRREIQRSGYSQLNIMGIVACKAAYRYGGEWLEGLKSYLFENLNFVISYLHANLPQVDVIVPEGTYLVWLDFSKLELTDDVIQRKMIHEAKLWLDQGTMFGECGRGFQRINIASPREILEKALQQLVQAFNKD